MRNAVFRQDRLQTGVPPFDWEAPGSWAPALNGVGAVYITCYPDLAVPGATEAIEAFCAQAMKMGIRRLVLQGVDLHSSRIGGAGGPGGETIRRLI